jgi:type I restriction enzyme R subunit
MKTESQTRKDLIDTKLFSAGWDVNNLSQVSQEFDIPVPLPDGVEEPRTPYEGHLFSDYVLLGRDRKPLAVVEAKKTSKDPAIGREQAKQYCYNILKQFGCKLPFCFYTNGLEIFFWDLDNYPPRKVVGFPTRDDLINFRSLTWYE